ncbi:MAG: NFACT family protein [Chloroflexi bacterium]|nr:NFACT family protein [Chloroflexota bacterium]
MPYDSLTLAAVKQDISLRLWGDRVSAVHQPEPLTLILTFSRKQRLLLSADPEYARLHFSSRDLPRPPVPPAFCMLLRKHLEGARLADLRQPHFDRVLEMDFRQAGETTTLVVEIMGRHSNIVLRGEDGVLKGVIKHIPSTLNRYRELSGGSVYVPPPLGDRVSPLDGALPEVVRTLLVRGVGAPLETALSQVLTGMSAVLASWLLEQAGLAKEEICGASAGQQEALERALGALREVIERGAYHPTIRQRTAGGPELDAWALEFPGDGRAETTDSSSGDSLNQSLTISEAVEQVHWRKLEARSLELFRGQLLGWLKQEIRRERRKLDDFDGVLAEAGRADEFRRWGQALLAYPNIDLSGVSLAELPDPASEGSVLSITLDPDATAVENAQRCFERARRSERSARRVLDLAAASRQKLEAMEEMQAMVSSTAGMESLQRAIDRAPADWNVPRTAGRDHAGNPAGSEGKTPGRSERKTKASEPSLPSGVRRLLSVSGHEILYGRSSTDNDFLTTRLARPNDLWFHVRGETSAHVVIRTNNQPDRVPRETILQAANLAAIHSSSKHSSYVPVDYTLRKYVVKRKSSAPGAVEYRSEKTLHVQPRLEGQ